MDPGRDVVSKWLGSTRKSLRIFEERRAASRPDEATALLVEIRDELRAVRERLETRA